MSDVIVANSLSYEIKDVRNKVHTRDCLVGIDQRIRKIVEPKAKP